MSKPEKLDMALAIPVQRCRTRHGSHKRKIDLTEFWLRMEARQHERHMAIKRASTAH